MAIHIISRKLIVICVSCLTALNVNDTGVCHSNKDGKIRVCCADYHIVKIDSEDHCRICPNGTHGINCKNNCTEGYYGQMCRNKCNCTTDKCNRKIGCPNKDSTNGGQSIHNTNIAVIVVLPILLIFTVTAIGLIIWKKRAGQSSNLSRKRNVGVDTSPQSNPEVGDVYAEIRESMMVENLNAECTRIKSTYDGPLDKKLHHCNNVYNQPID